MAREVARSLCRYTGLRVREGLHLVREEEWGHLKTTNRGSCFL